MRLITEMKFTLLIQDWHSQTSKKYCDDLIALNHLHPRRATWLLSAARPGAPSKGQQPERWAHFFNIFGLSQILSFPWGPGPRADHGGDEQVDREERDRPHHRPQALQHRQRLEDSTQKIEIRSLWISRRLKPTPSSTLGHFPVIIGKRKRPLAVVVILYENTRERCHILRYKWKIQSDKL